MKSLWIKWKTTSVRQVLNNLNRFFHKERSPPMHHDFFAWVRLLLFIIMILAFALFCSCAENRYQPEQPEPEEPARKEPIYITPATNPTKPSTFTSA